MFESFMSAGARCSAGAGADALGLALALVAPLARTGAALARLAFSALAELIERTTTKATATSARPASAAPNQRRSGFGELCVRVEPAVVLWMGGTPRLPLED